MSFKLLVLPSKQGVKADKQPCDVYTSMMNLTKQLIFKSKNMTMKVNLLLVYMLMTFRLEILPKPISIEFLLYYLMIIQYTIIKYMVAVIKIGECLLHYPKLLIARRNLYGND